MLKAGAKNNQHIDFFQKNASQVTSLLSQGFDLAALATSLSEIIKSTIPKY